MNIHGIVDHDRAISQKVNICRPVDQEISIHWPVSDQNLCINETKGAKGVLWDEMCGLCGALVGDSSLSQDYREKHDSDIYSFSALYQCDESLPAKQREVDGDHKTGPSGTRCIENEQISSVDPEHGTYTRSSASKNDNQDILGHEEDADLLKLKHKSIYSKPDSHDCLRLSEYFSECQSESKSKAMGYSEVCKAGTIQERLSSLYNYGSGEENEKELLVDEQQRERYRSRVCMSSDLNSLLLNVGSFCEACKTYVSCSLPRPEIKSMDDTSRSKTDNKGLGAIIDSHMEQNIGKEHMNFVDRKRGLQKKTILAVDIPLTNFGSASTEMTPSGRLCMLETPPSTITVTEMFFSVAPDVRAGALNREGHSQGDSVGHPDCKGARSTRRAHGHGGCVPLNGAS
ncbi:hypothetical protein MAR_037738 [Mya arenaria]|uniref:Uncharacterized protein n=1 Tax=Mya arenaria TaxID=6604 RepID=A0ABY7FSE1_MYAAR|nr:hypothetical protein MAR_037738 [Mya arenaria]